MTIGSDLYGINGYAVVDFETTGFSYGRGDRVLEVGVVKLDPSGQIVGTFESLINPLRDVGATHVHGITASDVMAAPTFADISDHLAAILDGSVFVAHNARFDAGFALNELAATGNFIGSSIPYLDTQAVSRRHIASKSQKLSDVIGVLGIENPHAHSALADALATAQLLQYFLHRTEACRESSWGEAITATQSCMDYRYTTPVAPPSYLTRQDAAQAREALRSCTWVAPAVDGRDTPDDFSTGQYFQLLDEVFLDRELSHRESQALLSFAANRGLSSAALRKLHEEYLRLLVASAWEDGAVTSDERATIELIGRYLGVPVERLTSMLQDRVPGESGARSSSSLLHTKIILAPGDRVTVTGPKLRSNAEWVQFFGNYGVKVAGLARSTKLLVAGDTNTMSGKAKKAREYEIPVVSESVVSDLLSFE